MVYTFIVVSDEVENFMREIKIDADATFLDLHDIIMKSVGFAPGGMSSFFITDEGWEKEKEITQEDMGSDIDQEVYLMDQTPISDFVEDTGQRLLFTFDYMTDRSLFMELKRSEAGKHLAEPEITGSRGEAPKQEVDIDSFIDNLPAAKSAASGMDLDDEMYGDSEYNEDEIDLDSISDGLPDY